MKRRSGIGNVIATAVMVFLVIFTVSQLYVYNLDLLDDYNRVALNVFNTNGQKLNERITINNVQIDVSGSSIKVSLTVANSGGTTAHIISVWMDDVDSSTATHVRVLQDTFVGAGLTATLNNLDTQVATASNHKILVKVLTELGNSASVELLPPGLAGTTSLTLATVSLTLVPPNPITSNNVVVVLSVTNTNSLGVAFTSLQPDVCVAQGSTAPLPSANVVKGTATAATANTLSDSTKAWTTNQWQNAAVTITSGTGSGQTGIVSSNTATQLTISGANWSPPHDTTSKYAISMSGTQTASPVPSSTTVGDSTKNWATNQWFNYVVSITSGTGAGQSRMISSNTATQLIVTPAWLTTPDTTSQYSILTNCHAASPGPLCNTTTPVTTAAPVVCQLVQGPTPTGLTYLPAGGSITFNWIYSVSSTISDTPITFVASYVNISLTNGLLTSQMPSQVATVRGAGGASASTGGNVQQIFGSLSNYFLSFQFSQDGINWKNGGILAANTNTMFRVNLTNLSPQTIAFNSTSEIFLMDLKTGASTDFFIFRACLANQPFYRTTFSPACTVQSYPSTSSGRYFVGPGQTVTLYYGATAAGGSSAQRSPVAGRSNLGIISMVGTNFQGQSASVAVGTTSLTITMSPSEPNTSYTPVVQTGWTTTATVPGATKFTTSFVIQFGTTAPLSCATQNCPTVSWGVWGPESPYSQAAPFFVVST